MADSESSSQSRRVRSPAYPSMSLEAAIEKAEVLYEKEYTHPATVDVVVGHWNYSPGTGPGNVALAALKHFGLLDESGKGPNRTVKLSVRALGIIQDEVPDSDDCLRFIQEAALFPTIYRVMWEKWGENLPSDQNIRTFLIKERAFNRRVVDDLIKDYKATISFAKLTSEGTLSNDQNDKTGGAKPQTGGKPPAKPPIHPKGDSDLLAAPSDEYKTFPFYLRCGRAVMHIPNSLSKEDLDLLKSQIESSLAVVEATSVVVSSSSEQIIGGITPLPADEKVDK